MRSGMFPGWGIKISYDPPHAGAASNIPRDKAHRIQILTKPNSRTPYSLREYGCIQSNRSGKSRSG